MERSKKYYGIVIFAAVLLIVVLAFCINRFVDKDNKNDDLDSLSDTAMSSDISSETSQKLPSEVTEENEDETEAVISASASLTDKNGEGQITLNTSYDSVKAVLDEKKISYDAEDMFIETKDGTTYLFWSNGSEKRVNSILLTSTAEGLKVGDSKEKIIRIYGDSTPVESNGKTYYCYISGAFQLTIRVEDNKVKGISFGYLKLNAPSTSDNTSTANLFSGEYTVEAAADANHQRAVKYTAEKGTRECFAQIAESQVGYVNGYSNGGNVVFPYSHTDGWNKYGNSAGMPISAWCALFISWCADRAGIDESYLNRSAIANINWQDYKDKDSYTPKRGDLIYFKYNGFNNEMSVNHVGIVVGYDAETKTITTVEGNARGGQCLKRAYRLDDPTSDIIGFSAVRF